MATEEWCGLIVQRVNNETRSLGPAARTVDQKVIAEVTHRQKTTSFKLVTLVTVSKPQTQILQLKVWR